MKKVADFSAYFFIFAVVLLCIISILGIWALLQDDVIVKSFKTLGVLTLVAVIIIVADHFMSPKRNEVNAGASNQNPSLPNNMSQTTTLQTESGFHVLKISTVVTLITSAVMLALLGIMSIWEILSRDVLHKSLSSIALIGFSSLIIIFVCIERDGGSSSLSKKISGPGAIILLIIGAYLAFTFLGLLF